MVKRVGFLTESFYGANSLNSRRKKRLPPGDDGHTVASMNVPGMPWYAESEAPGSPGEPPRTPPPLSRQETRWMMWGALKAALLVAAVFAVGIVAFVLLLLWMWK